MAAPLEPVTVVALGVLGAALFVGLAFLFYLSTQNSGAKRRPNKTHKPTPEEEKKSC